MAEHPDCALVRRAYEAFGKGDLDTVGSLMTDDVVHHVPGNNTLSGHHTGRAAVLNLYRETGELTDDTMRVELENVLTDGRGHVMTVHKSFGDHGDRGIEIHEGFFITVVEGKMTDIVECTQDVDEKNAFWGS
ncbi:hypothetical protein GCM10020367_31240 [Streptomyces sannanensis]|uniref:SnoaL-like domain-containing protein n=1 Tax=Streptomyces sannanensis TaxID=285536 RepID=A0ABP6SCU8_9ACTN